MLSQIKRLASRKSHTIRNQRRRSLLRSLEQLENRQLLAADVGFSTYSPAGQLGTYAMTSDADGNVYTAEYRAPSGAIGYDGALSKYSPSGQLLWTQKSVPWIEELIVDANGMLHALAWTTNPNLPTSADAFQPNLAGAADYYVAIYDSNQFDTDTDTLSSSELVYSTYLGGSSDEDYTFFSYGFDVDTLGNVYVAATTRSSDFPLTGQSFVDSGFGGSSEGFLAKFRKNGPADYTLEFSTFIGGSGIEEVTGVAVDQDGTIHVAGISSSPDLPTTADAYLSSNPDGIERVFLSRFDQNGNLDYSTFFGVSYIGPVLEVDDQGASYLAGRFNIQTEITTPGAFQTQRQGPTAEPFVAKFDPDGDLKFSTLFGGSGLEHVTELIVNSNELAIVGSTLSSDLPIAGPFQANYAGNASGNPAYYDTYGDAFIARLSVDGSSLISSTFLGGQGADSAFAATLTSDNALWVAGFTDSTDFPVTNGSQRLDTALDGFLSRFDLGVPPADMPILTVSDVEIVEGNSGTSEAVFQFSLAEALASDVSVDYATSSASATQGQDFAGVQGTLTIPAGQLAATVSVPVFGDNQIENDEAFVMVLSNAQGVRLSDSTPSGTIVNDDLGAADDFESGNANGGVGGWTENWSTGTYAGIEQIGGPDQGAWHGLITRNGELNRIVNTAGLTDLTLAFASKIESFESSDRAYVRVSPNGTNWTTLKTFTRSEGQNTYRDYSFDIPFETDRLWISFDGGMSSTLDRWYVDTVSVTGNVASQPPVASNDSGVTAEDHAVTIDVLANDSDPEGDALTIVSVTQPNSGSVAIVGGQVQYTPNVNFNGSDSFTYTVADTAGQTAAATVDVTITPVNDAPESVDDSVTTQEDTPVTFSVLGNDSDVDGDSLNIVSATNGANGSVTVNPDNTLTYDPRPGFHGTDTFSYTISDGNGGTSTAQVNAVVAERNDPPTGGNDSATTDEDVSLLINVLANDSDPDNDTLSIESVTQPASGTAAIEGGQVRYSPNANFYGSDSFTYTIVDTAGNTDTATVDVTITSVNDAPVGAANNYSLDQDTTLTIDAPGVLANDTDIDGDSLTAELVTGPTSGSIALNADGSFTYTPSSGFSGTDSFSYQAVDGSGATSNTVTVNLQVNAIVAGPNLSHGNVISVGSSWQTVSLGKSYNSAVIVATPRYNTGSAPGVVRISNVTANSFDVRVDSVGAAAFDGGIHFIAMEEGVYDVPGQYKLEAVKYDASATSRRSGWQIDSQGYQQSYSNPVVVGQVMSTNDEDWSVFWSSSGSRTSPANSGSLNVGKHVGEDSDTTRATETLGYFVIEATSSGVIDGLNFTAGVGSDTIRGVGNGTYQYSNVSPVGATTAVLSSAGMDGDDGGWAVLRGDNPLATTNVTLSIDEDQIRDSERNHTTEQVAYFVIGGPVGEGEGNHLATPQITIHDPVDVNGYGITSPIDALQVINRLNTNGGSTGGFGEEGDMALDVNGDGHLSPLDALLVINRLHADSAEGEDVRTPALELSAIDGYFGDLEDDEKESLYWRVAR